MNKNNIKLVKTVIKFSLICFICGIFLIPFAYFSITLLINYLNDNNLNNLSDFLLLFVVFAFLLFFYILFETILYLNIKKNKDDVNIKIYILSILNYLFTFITNFIILYIVIKAIFDINKIKNLFKRKNSTETTEYDKKTT